MARRPQRLWEQFTGKAKAELARGAGRWPVQVHPCPLEPPYEPHDRQRLSPWDCWLNNWEKPWEPSVLKRLFDFSAPVLARDQATIVLPAALLSADLVAIGVAQFLEDEATMPKAEQLLLSLPATRFPVAFELFGRGPLDDHPSISAVQFVADRADAALLRSQLFAQYPNASVTEAPAGLPADVWTSAGEEWREHALCGAQLALDALHVFPLRTFSRLDPDPLAAAIAAMDQLGEGEWALVQILFQAARAPWADTAAEAIADPYKPGDSLFEDVSERDLRTKFASPLFAVAVHLLANSSTVYRQLLGWAEQFASPPQRLVPNTDSGPGEPTLEYEARLLADAVRLRATFRPGMLFNLQELASLAHLPSESVASEWLMRQQTRTRRAPNSLLQGTELLLGENMHRGQTRRVFIPSHLRTSHAYVVGATGVGKSTLLLNLILEDIRAGRGVGVLDPHGDLAADLLSRIPRHRVSDVLYFNPADTKYPVGLNVLCAQCEHEHDRIVSEVVGVIRRFYPDSWGPRLDYLLKHAISTAVQVKGTTLRDVRRLLTDTTYRSHVVSQLADADLRAFWENEFPGMPRGSADPVLNKLGPFIFSATVRNVLCQRQSTVNFDDILNRQGILLANLSIGLLTPEVSGIFGTFLVSQILAAALRRQAMPKDRRPLWCLYVDEFQNFASTETTAGFDEILSQARKYGLSLTLANQFVSQVPDTVRASIFGNVASIIAFRLGIDDARIMARQFQGFFEEGDLLQLDLGRAIARVGGSDTAFNLATFPEPPRPTQEFTDAIIAHSRRTYARPREHVEAQFADDCPAPTARPTARRARSAASRLTHFDPNEDDLVR